MTVRELKAFVATLPSDLDTVPILVEEEGGYNYWTFDGMTLTRLPLSSDPVFLLGECIGNTGFGPTDVYLCFRM